jgi:hypothetical protein
MMARITDMHNMIALVCSDQFMRLERINAGKKTVLAETTGNFKLTGIPNVIRITCQDRSVVCTVNGTDVLQGENINFGQANGGIGFKIWDSQIDNSEILVEAVTIQ